MNRITTDYQFEEPISTISKLLIMSNIFFPLTKNRLYVMVIVTALQLHTVTLSGMPDCNNTYENHETYFTWKKNNNPPLFPI